MKDQPSLNAADQKPTEEEMSMKDLWDKAAVAFERICGESLQRGDVKTFDDVRRKIEEGTKASYDTDEGEDKWEKAKSVGLKSLKFMKMLVGAASQASGVVCCIASLFSTRYTLKPPRYLSLNGPPTSPVPPYATYSIFLKPSRATTTPSTKFSAKRPRRLPNSRSTSRWEMLTRGSSGKYSWS